jgi:hypothetical protein
MFTGDSLFPNIAAHADEYRAATPRALNLQLARSDGNDRDHLLDAGEIVDVASEQRQVVH